MCEDSSPSNRVREDAPTSGPSFFWLFPLLSFRFGADSAGRCFASPPTRRVAASGVVVRANALDAPHQAGSPTLGTAGSRRRRGPQREDLEGFALCFRDPGASHFAALLGGIAEPRITHIITYRNHWIVITTIEGIRSKARGGWVGPSQPAFGRRPVLRRWSQ